MKSVIEKIVFWILSFAPLSSVPAAYDDSYSYIKPRNKRNSPSKEK